MTEKPSYPSQSSVFSNHRGGRLMRPMMNRTKIQIQTGATLLLLSLATACGNGGGNGDGSSSPSVVSNQPADGASGVAVNASISATFSEGMDPATLTNATFTLTSGAPVPGT